MRYTTFPSTGWQVPVIGMGCWGLGGQWGQTDVAVAVATLEHALAAGITLFDTADAYGTELGTSESLLGRTLLGRRHQVLIATKAGAWGVRQGARVAITHPCHVALCCDASLHRLRTDYIDLYQCHLGDCGDPELWLEAFARLQRQGKIRAFGISTDRLDVAQAFHRQGGCAAVQLDCSLVNRGACSGLLPWCAAQRIATLIRGPLAQGLLTGKFTPASTFTDQVRQGWNSGAGRAAFLERLALVERLRAIAAGRLLTAFALRALLADPAVTTLIPGARSPAQLDDQLAALDLPWSAADDQALAALAGGG